MGKFLFKFQKTLRRCSDSVFIVDFEQAFPHKEFVYFTGNFEHKFSSLKKTY